MFFFNDTATTEIYTLSLHDALPIYRLAPLLDQLAEAKYGPSATDNYSSAGIVSSCLEVLSGLESTREPNVA